MEAVLVKLFKRFYVLPAFGKAVLNI